MSEVLLPSDAAIKALYDFKGILEPAIARLFVIGGIKTVITSVTAPDFQSAIPRSELSVTVGSAQNRWAQVQPGVLLNYAWDASLKVRAITKADKVQKGVHALYRTRIFYIAEMSGYLSNGQDLGLVNHKINWPIVGIGTSDTFKTDDGFEYSDQTFSFKFSITPAALQTLQTPNVLANQ